MENMFNIEEHTDRYTTLFAQPQVSLDTIRAFIDTENRFNGHLSKNHIQNYGRLFHTLRDRLIVPNHNKFNLLSVFEELATLMRRSNIVLPPSDAGQKIITAFRNSYDANDAYWKLNILRMDMVLCSFLNCVDRMAFLEKLSQMRSVECFSSLDDIKSFSQAVRMLFDTAENFMTHYAKIFSPQYIERDIISFKAGIIWIVEITWGVAYKEHPAHMLLMEPLINILNNAIEKKYDEAVFYLHFPLSHIYMNLSHTQNAFRTFNEKVEMPISRFMADNMRRWGIEPVAGRPDSQRKKIGFVFDRLVGSSPVKLLVSLINYMKDEPYDLFIYDMGYIEKAHSSQEYINEVLTAGAKYINGHDLIGAPEDRYYSHFEKCKALRNAVIADGIDILIVTSNRTQVSFLCAARSAPEQLYWDHGNHEYNIIGIDKRICHFYDGHNNEFQFDRFTLPMLQKYLAPDEEKKKAEAAEIKKKLPPHKVVLGSIGRLMKLSDEYLETVADILKQNQDTIYLACGSGPIEEKRAKVRALGVEDRFIFAGWVDPHVYGHVIDIYLNTFPLKGGESVNEFRAKGSGKLVVSTDNT